MLTDDGYLRHKQSGMVVDVEHNRTAPGTPIIIWSRNDPTSANQQWTLTVEGFLRSNLAGRLIGLASDAPTPGARVAAATVGSPHAQPWYFVRDVAPARPSVNRALALNGTDQSVTVAAPEFGATDLTLEAWVRTTRGGPLIATSRSTGLGVVTLAAQADGRLFFGMSDGHALMVSNTGPTTVLDGGWHHVAAVRRGTTGQLLLDGVPVPPSAQGVAEPRSPVRPVEVAELMFGAAVPPPPLVRQGDPLVAFALEHYWFAGEIDEVRIWARVRAPEEIATGMHHRVSDADPGLLGRWSFDAGDATDSTPYRRDGRLHGAPVFVNSEVDLVAPGEPYLVTQAALTQDWVTSPAEPAGMREISGYRVVVTAHEPDGSPVASYLSVSSADPVTVHLADGSRAELGGDELACTRRTDTRGQLSFTIDAKGALTCPAVKIRADFMGLTERLVVYPDRHAHLSLAAVTGNTLLGRADDGTPLPSVTKKRRPAPLPPGTDPAAAHAVAQAVAQVMSTAVRHDVRSDRPLTRARSLPEDVPVPRPYLPRYQDVALAARGFDADTDTVATHFLAADHPVVRVLVPENASTPHWTYDHVGRSFRALTPAEVARALDGLQVRHLDDYTRRFQLDADVFSGRRRIAMRSDELVDTAKRELSARWFGGDFLAEVADAVSVIVTTVETVVTDAATEIENVVRTIVVTVVTGITDAITGLVQAFDAALQTVEDAVDFVGAVLRKVGAEVATVVEFLRDLFEWDDILVTHQVIEKYLVESRSVLGRMLHGAGDRAVEAVESFRRSFDRDMAAWRASINPGVVQRQATTTRTAPPPDIRSGYLTSMFSQNVGTARGGDLGTEFGALVGTVRDELTAATAGFIHTVPGVLDHSGFSGAFADPDALLGAGIDVLLQAIQAVVDLALEMTEDVLRAVVAALDRLIDALFALATARLDIPVLTGFYEQVVMRGNGSRLTLLSLVALAAAVPMTVAYKALTGRDEPVFGVEDRDAFLATDAGGYTWIRDPFAGRERAARGATLPISDRAIQALSWAGGFVYTASAAVWGIAATFSDGIWVAEAATMGSSTSLFGEAAPNQPKFQRPLCYVVLGSQALCLVAGMPWSTDFAKAPDAIAFGLWAAQFVPLASNLTASVTPFWGKVGDPALTGAYGVVCLGLTAWLWYARDRAVGADHAANAAEGMANIFGNLAWSAQLLKLSPAQNIYTIAALLALDVVGYAGVSVTTLARTIADMTAQLT